MRYLAISRFRLLTAIRTATAVFVVLAVPPLIAMLFLGTPEPLFRALAGDLLGVFARAAVFAWLFHALMVLAACEAFGSSGLIRPDLTLPPSDLMDSVPIGRPSRFWGEALGIFAAILTVHVCCLPLLAVVSVLSPLPTGVFVWIETGMIVMMIFASAGAAWKRLAPWTRYSSTRTARSLIFFFILFFLILFSTTKWESFRDSLGAFLVSPSMRAWGAVTAAVESPMLLVMLFALLYGGYLVFYVTSALRPAQE